MTQIVCANCGQALRPTDKFCYNCGAKVQPVKMKPEVEKAVPEPEQVRPVMRPQPPKPEVKPEAPKEVQEEKPKFHMDEAMSWNTDGYPEAKRQPVQNPEEADFSWSDTTAQDRMRKRQEEGRRALYEEQEARRAAKEKAAAEAAEQFAETPEAEEVVKAVDEQSTIPVSDFKVDVEPEPTPEAVVEEPAAEVEAPAAEAESYAEKPVEAEQSYKEAYQAAVAEPEVKPEKIEEPVKPEVPEQSFREAYQAAVSEPEVKPSVSDEEAEADDDYVVPTIESIEKDAEAAKARQTEKDIFGYTLDDIDSGARAEGSSGAEVIDKFYTYSKKQEEFQELLNQENEKLKGSRPDAAQPVSSIQDELDKVTAVEEDSYKPEKPIETGGFVGVQLPETPESVEAYKEPAAPVEEYKAPEAPAAEPVLTPEIPAVEEVKVPAVEVQEEKAPETEFLGGNFGKADDITMNAEAQPEEDKSSENTVAAAAGAVAAGAAAIAAAREKARAKIEAEKAAETVDKPFEEVITEESEKAREQSLADAAEEAAKAKAAEIKAAEEAQQAIEAETAETQEITQEEAEKSIAEVIANEAAPEPQQTDEKVQEDDHKLTYQEVFSDEAEKAPKHTLLKVLAILILLLIILEVAAILIRRFAPDSAIGLQIQQIYEMIFSRFI